MSKTFNRILVPVDFSAYSTEALLYAASMSEHFSSSLVVLHVISKEIEWRTTHQWLGYQSVSVLSPFSESLDVPSEVAESVTIDLHDRADRTLRAFLPDEIRNLKPQVIVRVGDPFEQILDAAEHEDIALIVMGTHGRSGLAHTLLGSVAERIVRLAPCPVLTVKAPQEESST